MRQRAKRNLAKWIIFLVFLIVIINIILTQFHNSNEEDWEFDSNFNRISGIFDKNQFDEEVDVIVFMHIPKTGGSYFDLNLLKNLGRESDLIAASKNAAINSSLLLCNPYHYYDHCKTKSGKIMLVSRYSDIDVFC